jgi:hypothetical protein
MGAVVAHNRDRDVASLVGVPVADAGALVHGAEPVVQGGAGVRGAVLVAEDQVLVVPGLAGGLPFLGLALLVRDQGLNSSARQAERAPGLGCLGVAVASGGAPDVDHALVQVDVVPGEGAQFAGTQAERDGHDEQCF